MIQSLRHLTAKKFTSMHDDSILDKISSELSKNPFEEDIDMDFESDFSKQRAIMRRSTTIMPMTAKAGRGSLAFKNCDPEKKELSQ